MTMALSDLFGRAKDEDVGGFDENEAGDLALHVRQCTRRYRALDRKLDLVIRLIIVLLGLYVLNVPGGVKMMLALLGG
jgi:hypothetical protein